MVLPDIRLPFRNLKICVQQSSESVTLKKNDLGLHNSLLLLYTQYLRCLYKFVLFANLVALFDQSQHAESPQHVGPAKTQQVKGHQHKASQ